MSRLIDLTGQTFGRLTVLRREGSDHRNEALWLCECSCDSHNRIIATGHNLRSGHTQSCGCYWREQTRKANTTHGDTGTRLHGIWKQMRDRCYRQTNKAYPQYGGRGIVMYPEWQNDFATFREWAYANGYNDTLSIDRIDVDGIYEPSNCRWATRVTQNRNKRSNRVITINGVSKTMADWCDELGVTYATVCARINKLGWTPEEALGLKPRQTTHGEVNNAN